jgi:hypothetical protein
VPQRNVARESPDRWAGHPLPESTAPSSRSLCLTASPRTTGAQSTSAIALMPHFAVAVDRCKRWIAPPERRGKQAANTRRPAVTRHIAGSRAAISSRNNPLPNLQKATETASREGGCLVDGGRPCRQKKKNRRLCCGEQTHARTLGTLPCGVMLTKIGGDANPGFRLMRSLSCRVVRIWRRHTFAAQGCEKELTEWASSRQ